MGFFTFLAQNAKLGILIRSQSLSGWDGVFHCYPLWSWISRTGGRNPFQGGMGFFTARGTRGGERGGDSSQSLSGWDGVFHSLGLPVHRGRAGLVAIPFRVGWGFSLERAARRVWIVFESQSLSGWDGVFHSKGVCTEAVGGYVAIPFRVGWGFSPVVYRILIPYPMLSQSLSGWDGVFHQETPENTVVG